MAPVKAWLDAYDPRLWFVAVALVVFLIVAGVKKFLPKVWDMIPARFQAIPATIIGALLSATADQHVADIIMNVIMGAVSGITAVGGYHFVDRLKSGSGKAPDAPDAAPQKPA